MIDPRTVLVAIPCHDGRIMSETAGSLQQCVGLYAAVSMPAECSHVSLVRNLIAGQFLASPFEWLVCVDNDIAFSRRDLELLLEPCDPSAEYLEDFEASDALPAGVARFNHNLEAAARPPRPTRTTLGLSVDPKAGYDVKMVGAVDLLVCAQYSYKNDNLEPVQFGMGFVRIHKSVFKMLEALKHDGGPTIEVQRHEFERLRERLRVLRGYLALSDSERDTYPNPPPVLKPEEFTGLFDSAEDKAGTARLWQTSHKGRLYTDFFPSGPILSQFVPTAEWKGEDHGFFTLCMLAGIIPRVETRTRLIHLGRKGYPYLGPDGGGGQ